MLSHIFIRDTAIVYGILTVIIVLILKIIVRHPSNRIIFQTIGNSLIQLCLPIVEKGLLADSSNYKPYLHS